MDAGFNRAVVFGDAHFGRSGDSPSANQDNLDFLDWMIGRARSWGAETCIFLGDFYHNRASIGVASLDAALTGLERLSAAGFEKIICLKGNHDLARRQHRGVSSLNSAAHVRGIQVVHDPLTSDGVTFLPWLFESELGLLPGIRSRYVFAHLETVGAMMNARVACPAGHLAVDADVWSGPEHVFTGHFHQRQALGRKPGKAMVTYVGNIMPFDFSDANDADRGVMLLRWGHDPCFEAWPGQPLYRTASLSQLLGDLAGLRPNMTVRALIDIDLGHEEAQQMRDMLVESHGLRKFELLKPAIAEQGFASGATGLHTVEQIVVEGLSGFQGSGVSAERLVSIFNALPRR